MFCFLETNKRAQKKYEKRIQTSADDTLYRYVMKIVVKSSLKIFEMFETLLFFSKQKYILFLETYLVRLLRIQFFVFLAEADTKKHRYASAKTSNSALVKPTD